MAAVKSSFINRLKRKRDPDRRRVAQGHRRSAVFVSCCVRAAYIEEPRWTRLRATRTKTFPLEHLRAEPNTDMKLAIAIAVLVLALVAQAEDQEDPTVQERLANFHNQMKELGESLVENAKATFEKVHNSEFATNARTWLSKQMDKLKAQFE
ncbi:apolipoprotein C-I, acidic form-like [Arapaima gigas]